MTPLRLFATLLLFVPLAAAANAFVPAPPQIAATGYVLMDFDSGRVIAESNADQRMEPASLTKMMTAYVVFSELADGHIQLSDPVRISEKAWRTIGSRMFVDVGSQVSVEELLQGMIIQSGNDASVALAEYVGGSEEAFVALMNDHARRLGLTGSHFVNSTGLPDPQHHVTVRDMAMLTASLIQHFPEFYKWYSEKEYTYNNITQRNRNLLLWRDESVDGVKTGHTDSAGYCLASSAQRDGMRLVSVVMGTRSEKARADESQKLLNWGFRFYETHRLFVADAALKTMRIWKGSSEMLPLGITEPLYVTVPRGQYEQLNASLTVERTIIAPAEKGQALGLVKVQLGEETLAERPLVALASVTQGTLWQQLKDNVMLWFE